MDNVGERIVSGIHCCNHNDILKKDVRGLDNGIEINVGIPENDRKSILIHQKKYNGRNPQK